ncbi:hypothetical protein JZ751_019199 [Albula glossodonta]|uniref:Uncharacterized protein n=1 Tax=Albula glossodonta TaxID=121402 RepID=A0A8T2NUW6_9TELE|nr:hypothetical protein JZ751_019199 [Albula glossodonta]
MSLTKPSDNGPRQQAGSPDRTGRKCAREPLPEAGVRAAQVEQGDVEQGAGHVFGPDLGVLGDGVRLRQLPARADVDDGMDDCLALLVHEGQRRALVGDGQGELVLVHQADLFDFRGVFEGVVKHLQVLLQGQRGRWKLLLVGLHVLGQPSRRVNEQELLAALQAREQSLVILGVLAHPRVAVVDVDGCHVLVGKTREDHKPLGQEVSLEAVARPSVGQVHHNLVGLGVVGLEGQQHVVDQQRKASPPVTTSPNRVLHIPAPNPTTPTALDHFLSQKRMDVYLFVIAMGLATVSANHSLPIEASTSSNGDFDTNTTMNGALETSETTSSFTKGAPVLLSSSAPHSPASSTVSNEIQNLSSTVSTTTTRDAIRTTTEECLMGRNKGVVFVITLGSALFLGIMLLISTILLACKVCFLKGQLRGSYVVTSNGDPQTAKGPRGGKGGEDETCLMLEEVKTVKDENEEGKNKTAEAGGAQAAPAEAGNSGKGEAMTVANGKDPENGPETAAVSEAEPSATPASTPTATAELATGATPASEPATVADPQPGVTPASKPVTVAEPQPGATPASKPVTVAEPQPRATPASKPAVAPKPDITATSTLNPATTTKPEPGATPSPETAATSASEPTSDKA